MTTRNECVDRVSYIDSKGVEHEREPLNYYWDFEQIVDDKEDTPSTIDWDQVRIQASISAMQIMLCRDKYCVYDDIAMQAVGYADALIEKLKK
jgi:hypothetical protein